MKPGKTDTPEPEQGIGTTRAQEVGNGDFFIANLEISALDVDRHHAIRISVWNARDDLPLEERFGAPAEIVG